MKHRQISFRKALSFNKTDTFEVMLWCRLQMHYNCKKSIKTSKTVSKHEKCIVKNLNSVFNITKYTKHACTHTLSHKQWHVRIKKRMDAKLQIIIIGITTVTETQCQLMGCPGRTSADKNTCVPTLALLSSCNVPVADNRI